MAVAASTRGAWAVAVTPLQWLPRGAAAAGRRAASTTVVPHGARAAPSALGQHLLLQRVVPAATVVGATAMLMRSAAAGASDRALDPASGAVDRPPDPAAGTWMGSPEIEMPITVIVKPTGVLIVAVMPMTVTAVVRGAVVDPAVAAPSLAMTGAHTLKGGRLAGPILTAATAIATANGGAKHTTMTTVPLTRAEAAGTRATTKAAAAATRPGVRIRSMAAAEAAGGTTTDGTRLRLAAPSTRPNGETADGGRCTIVQVGRAGTAAAPAPMPAGLRMAALLPHMATRAAAAAAPAGAGWCLAWSCE